MKIVLSRDELIKLIADEISARYGEVLGLEDGKELFWDYYHIGYQDYTFQVGVEQEEE